MLKKVNSTSELSGLKKFGQKCIDVGQRIAQNTVVASIMEGFMMIMPIIIASTFFVLIAELPGALGADLASNVPFGNFKAWCMRLYNLSFGMVGLCLSFTIASRFTEKINPRLASDKKLNPMVIAFSSFIAFMLISVGPSFMDSGYWPDGKDYTVNPSILGVKGIFMAMITGTTVPWFFYWCYKLNITIRLPKQVPQNISQAFMNIFPLLFVILVYGTFGWIFATYLNASFLDWLFKQVLGPMLDGMSANWFFVVWSFVLSLTWFVGIHVSVWTGITEVLGMNGLDENIALIGDGSQATNLWANPFKQGAFSMGGTGAQIAIPLAIIIFCKSKQLRSIGMVALVPVLFQVNEPLLFGIPSILNPLMAIPFLVTPILTSLAGVFFVEVLGMNASYVAMPWSSPMFLAIPLTTGMQWMSFILPFVWFGLSFVMYSPFLIMQDNVYYKKEFAQAEIDGEFVDFRNGITQMNDYFFRKELHLEIKEKKAHQKELDQQSNNDNATPKEAVKSTKAVKTNKANKTYEVLVVCIGAGTSAMLAETINRSFKNSNDYKINAKSCAIGSYSPFMADTDIVIISPQARAVEKDMLQIAKTKNLIVHQTKGAEFIEMIQSEKNSHNKIVEHINTLTKGKK